VRISDYWNVLVKRWPVLVALVAVTALSSYVYSKIQTKVYRATTTISVTSERFDNGQMLAAQQLLSVYAKLIQRDELVKRVDDQLKVDLDPLVLKGHIKVTPISESLLEQIDVDDSDPGRAADLANGLANAFIQEITDQQQALQAQDRVLVTMVDPAHPPTAPNRPKTRTNVLVGALVGLILGVVAAFGLDALDDSIKSAEDVDAVLGLPVLGVIPKFGSKQPAYGRSGSPPPGRNGTGSNGAAVRTETAGARSGKRELR
jgi:capsular polysaccharide biosynthesis protein